MTNDTIIQKFVFRALFFSIQDGDVEFIFLILNSVLKNDMIIQKFVFRVLSLSIEDRDVEFTFLISLTLY